MGEGINEQFSSVPHFDKFGVVTGSSGSIVTFADNECKMARFKADADNNATFFLGEAGAGYVAFPLGAGDDTGWVATSDLDRYTYYSASGIAELLYFWLQK